MSADSVEAAVDTPWERTRAAATSPLARSRLTNGALHVEAVDGRSAPARRWRDVYAAYGRALGVADPPLAVLAMVRTAATLTVTLELLDARAARGEPVDCALLVKTSGELRRVLRALGLAAVEPESGNPDPPAPDLDLAAARRYARTLNDG